MGFKWFKVSLTHGLPQGFCQKPLKGTEKVLSYLNRENQTGAGSNMGFLNQQRDSIIFSVRSEQNVGLDRNILSRQGSTQNSYSAEARWGDYNALQSITALLPRICALAFGAFCISSTCLPYAGSGGC